MNVKELKEYLNQYPDEMEVVIPLEDGNYQLIDYDNVDIVKGAYQEGRGGLVTRSYSWMRQENKDKDYLLIG